MQFSKYHALGNDYLVLRPEEFGVGSDGFLAAMTGPVTKIGRGTMDDEMFTEGAGEP
jgi:hypothetical protein